MGSMTKKSSYWISSGKFTLLERLSLLFTGILNFYLLVRVMDKEDYGTWIIFLTITTLLDTARNGFFQNPLIRFLNNGEETPEQKIKIQYTSFILNLGLSTAFALLMLLVMYPISIAWDNSELFTLFLIYLGTNIVHSFLFHFEYILKANFRFKGSFLAVLIRGISLIVIISYYFITKTHLPIWLLAVYYSISAFIGVIFSYFFVRDIFVIGKSFDRVWARQLFGYGSYTLGSNISAVLLRYIDTWMLGIFISPVAVAVYNVAIRIANLFEVPSMAIASMLFPKAVQQAKEKGDKAFKDLYEKSVAVIILLVFPFVILAITFSDQIILLLAGEEYMETANILKVTMLYGLIIPLNKQMGILLEAIGKAKKNMLFVARNAAINFVLNAIAIPIYGTIGAAYATLATMLIAAVLNQVYMAKHFNVEFLSLPKYLKMYTFMIFSRLKSLSTGIGKQ